ncbi:MAG: efflux RND transporter periplasmic adaptor subunit, partial [Hyphomicrobiales bacterium]|nr:efflux RND transporter periplasmic adaptor subunit [Hyphomicrobiales bacterium]
TRVERGGLIAQLDLEPFQLTLEQAKLNLAQAERDLARRKQLGPNTVSQVTIDDSETAASLARVTVRNAEYSLRQATLEAPFDALIASRNVENYTSVTAGTSIVRLHDMSELRVEIDVPEILFRQAQEGNDDVQIVAILPETDEPIPLEFREFNAETSAVGQTYAITLAMTPPGESLLPGASVTVAAKRKLTESKIIVPSTAVVIDPDKSTHLMVFEPKGADEGSVRKVPVELATDDKGQFVLASDIEDGIEIVMAGASQLTDGQQVRRFTGL